MALLHAFLAILILCLPLTPAHGDSAPLSDKIVFGQSTALNGSGASIGRDARDGITAAFQEANALGGVHGRLIELISRDDGYEPERAEANARELVEKDKVFAMIGGLGSTTANAMIPVLQPAGIPLIGPISGAAFLRAPFNPLIVNIRPSYEQEAEAWVHYLADTLHIKRFAMFYQDDAYGLAGLRGARKALAARGLSFVGQGAYKRNTLAVKEAALLIASANPEAVLMTGIIDPSATFIRLMKSLGSKTIFAASSVGSDSLSQALGPDGDGVIVSQFMPMLSDTGFSIVLDYQAALKKYVPQSTPSFSSLEGYVAARLALAVLGRMPDPPTPAAFVKTLYEIGSFDLGGLRLSFNQGRNQGLDAVYLTQFDKSGHFLPADPAQR